jgi:hypothetical protein
MRRPEHFSGRAEKILLFRAEKIPAHDHPTGSIEPQFSGRARAWAGRPRILSCKTTKNSISGRAQAKKIFRGLQDLCPQPSSKVRGRAWRGPGPGRAQNAQV